MENLTKQQKIFVQEYIKTLDAKQSAAKAGYQKQRAKLIGEQLLRMKSISDAIEEALKRQISSLLVSKAYIIKRLLTIIEFSVEEEDILDKEGNKTGKTKLKDTQSSLRALDFLAKQVGLAGTTGQETESEPRITIIDNLNEKKI